MAIDAVARLNNRQTGPRVRSGETQKKSKFSTPPAVLGADVITMTQVGDYTVVVSLGDFDAEIRVTADQVELARNDSWAEGMDAEERAAQLGRSEFVSTIFDAGWGITGTLPTVEDVTVRQVAYMGSR